MTVASPEDALARIEWLGWAFALLITDLDLPGMNGLELARRAQEAQTSLKIVCLSGIPRNFRSGLENRADSWPLLAKPFSLFELYDMVRDVLDGAKPSIW